MSGFGLKWKEPRVLRGSVPKLEILPKKEKPRTLPRLFNRVTFGL
jgi:hypothetical protein